MEYFDLHAATNVSLFDAAEARLLDAFFSGTESHAYRDAERHALVSGMNAALSVYHTADHIWGQRESLPAVTYGASDIGCYRAKIDEKYDSLN
ncbi:hypothetical protein EOD42_25470 [Rhodovarius crocodyli]|uniref:Uncharacterized protein n=1 Tax=Rhodovarius crocodyli TaxID=1979269 RepID=A0A437LVA4_9PROT|nr:hypothetical protein [Rhodovarius crocodyli]RVT89294.1 hypothetical protein EOD42_25470 [Rhodovarius crocodyli]